jgi:spore coat protein CotH
MKNLQPLVAWALTVAACGAESPNSAPDSRADAVADLSDAPSTDDSAEVAALDANAPPSDTEAPEDLLAAPDAQDIDAAPPDSEGDLAPAEPETAGDLIFTLDRVATVSLELAPADWADITANPKAEAWKPGTLVYDGRRLAQVQIRVKGNSSLNQAVGTRSHRYPFKVDLDDTVNQDLDGETKLVFNNGFKDPTFLREVLGYELMRALGVPAPRVAFVDLTVAGEHLGLYTMVENVDKRFLRHHFPDDEGDLYKPEPPAGSLDYRGDSPANYANMELESNETTSDGSTFVALVKALEDGRPEDALDVDMALRYLAVNALLVSLDSYLGTGHNYYLYELDGRFTVIPWDMNEAFGTFTCGCNRASLIDFKIDGPTCGARSAKPLIDVLLSNPTWLEAYHAYLATLLAGPFTAAALEPRITALAALIRPYVEADPTRFYSLSAFDTGLTTDVNLGAGGTGGTSIGLLAFIAERSAKVSDQLEGATSTAPDGSCPGGMGPPPPR